MWLSLDNWKIIPPSLASWVYAISVHGACCVFGGVPFGIILFYVLPKKNPRSSSTTRALSGVLIGIVAATNVYVGRPFIENFSPNNEITFMGPLLASTFGFTTFFKALNVAFGTYPEGSDSDLQTWLLWFVMTPEPTFAKGKLCKANRKEVLDKMRAFVAKIIALFLLLTVLMLHPPPYYQVMTERSSSFSSNESTDLGDGDGVFESYLSTHVNGFFHLWLLYLFFSFCLDFSTLTNYVLSGGVRMEPAFCNPLLESRSFKETWGSRWNRPVNALLKRTIYIPARRAGFDQKVSALLTFFGSGLLHEYNFSIHNNRSLSSPSGYRQGEVTAFFLLMGILMIVESWVWNRCFPRWLQTAIDHLPSVLTASILTIMVSGLAEHHFLRPWFQSGFVEAVAEMLPRLTWE
jgi:hypothetical protein